MLYISERGQFLVNGEMECGATVENYAQLFSTDCKGNRACYKSNIESRGRVRCSGHYSCVESDIISSKHAINL